VCVCVFGGSDERFFTLIVRLKDLPSDATWNIG
jgi:hypothetical protein